MSKYNEARKHRILILGASGFIGNAIYKELSGYFKVFGTYRTPRKEYEKNHQFFEYHIEEDDVHEILKLTHPTIIISALRGDFSYLTIVHQHIFEYVKSKSCKIIFLSSSNVFDAYSKYPSYELDKTFSLSKYGLFKIKIENLLLKLPPKKTAIIRLPMVFGVNSPRITELKRFIAEKKAIEIFPNLIVNIALENNLTQQIHYIINRNKSGVFHLGSTDLIHHEDFIKDIVKHLGVESVNYKNVYTTNDERYLAVLSKENKIPKHLNMTIDDILKSLFKTKNDKQ